MRKIHLVGLVIIAIAIAGIISTYGNVGTYSDFSEAKGHQKDSYVVAQLVKDKEIYYDPLKDANYFSFFARDNKGLERQVIFLGSKPHDFERSEQIVLTGRLKDDWFYASKILMKCPSKYSGGESELKEFQSHTPLEQIE